MAKTPVSELDRFPLAPSTAVPRLVGASFGDHGCIAGDVALSVRRQERHTRPLSMKRLYEQFNGIVGRWDPSPTYLQSLTTDERLFYNRIVAVTESGVRPIVRVEFSDGTSLRATPDHPVLTGNGFVPAEMLGVDASIVGRGDCAIPQGRQSRPDRHTVCVKFHPYGHRRDVTPVNERTRTVRTYSYREMARARLVVEAAMNGLDYQEFVEILKTDQRKAATLLFLSPALEVHHRNERTLDDRFENLEVMTKEQHARHHSSRLDLLKVYTRSKRVRRIVDEPAEMTYDVQMAAPAHNFCAGETVVHNTGKTRFWLTGPAPVVVLSFDRGTEGVVEEFRQDFDKEIRVKPYDWEPTNEEDDASVTKESAILLRNEFIADFRHACSYARTVVVDTESAMWNLFRYAEFGSPKADVPRDFDKVNQLMQKYVALPKKLSINCGFIQSVKDEWKSQSAKTGTQKRWGFDQTPKICLDDFLHTKSSKGFELTVMAAHGRQAKLMQGQTYENIDLPTLGQIMFPDTDASDWGAED